MTVSVKRVGRPKISTVEQEMQIITSKGTSTPNYGKSHFHNILNPSSNATAQLAINDENPSSDITTNHQHKRKLKIKRSLSSRISTYAPTQTDVQLSSKSATKTFSFPLCHTTRKQKIILLMIFVAIVGICCLSILTPVLILRQKNNIQLSSFANLSVSMCSRSTCIGQETPYRTSMTTRLYAFDGNLYDSIGTAAGTALGVPPSASFGMVSMAGQTYFMSSFNFQYVSIPYVNLSQQSFTFQTWIAPYIDNTTEMAVFSQCGSTDNICFSLSLRNYHIIVSFDCTNPNDVPLISSSIIPFNIWTHITVVYDAVALQQLLYINGRIDTVSMGMIHPYRGTPAGTWVTAIGYSPWSASLSSYFYGYIDQLTISSGSVRSACQILNDATLLVYFPFDAVNQLIDQSVYNNYGYTSNAFTFTSGHIQEAILFNSSTSYFQSQCYPTTRTTMPFTVSLWIYPTAAASGGTIVHLSILQNGTGSLCYDLLALTSTGHIVAQLMYTVTNVTDFQGPVLPNNTWTHIALIYGYTNGMRLYVNGALTAMSRPYVTIPFHTYATLFMTLANTNPKGPAYPVNCPTGSSTGFVPGPFSGAIDDFRFYIRELDGQEICVLANM